MTAMPPTKGHANLIRFAASLADEVHAFVCTQPGEPFPKQRFWAVNEIVQSTIGLGRAYHLNMELPQDPETPGFWELWQDIMQSPSDYMDFYYKGVQPGDYIVSSEPYGMKLADLTGAKFMPYDPKRELLYTKATDIRQHPAVHFADIAPEFQYNLRTNITVFGAESTGKTTLSKRLAEYLEAHWFYEWARPYLETVGPDITVDSMTAIWEGQRATQLHSYDFYDKPYAVFDTDLFSTVGYWEQPHWADALGPVPKRLVQDATRLKSDLYIITKSNIPFEVDPLRYGGDHRESPDEFWIGVAEKYDLNYVVLEQTGLEDRLTVSVRNAILAMRQKTAPLAYDRKGY
jgi:NadR type nicotinamide-nucleotide adenylyltransferase